MVDDKQSLFRSLRAPVARWSPNLKQLPALSLKQPWARLVVSGYKDIENRSWRTTYRGALLIHASRSKPDYSSADIEKLYGLRLPDALEMGGIVGIVEVIDCVKQHASKWKFPASWGWVLQNPRRLPFRPCKGFVGLFKAHFER
jgi:hypothetical protein